jgi:hypothetical protein
MVMSKCQNLQIVLSHSLANSVGTIEILTSVHLHYSNIGIMAKHLFINVKMTAVCIEGEYFS